MTKHNQAIVKSSPKSIFTLFLAGLVMVSFGTSTATSAIASKDRDFYGGNDIVFYDADSTATCTPTGGVSTDASAGSSAPTASLPAETIKALDSQNVKQKAEKNKAAYTKGESEGVPWAVLAALHYREGGMDSGRSIADGERLGAGTSIDGVKIGGTLEEDAVLAAKHLKQMAKSVYQKTLSKDSSGDDWAYAFLAYNRGNMYKNWNKTPSDSPYVMNGYDDSHLHMKWISADSYDRPGGHKYNSIAGTTDGNAGAMSVLAYLGGPTAAGVSCGSGGGAVAGNIIETAKNFAYEKPQSNHHSNNFEKEAKPEFVSAVKKYNPKATGIGHVAYADCGIFVSTVMRASGADPDFPPAGTSVMMPYLSGSSKYESVTPNASNLQPGDILIYSHGSNGHIALYSGPIAEYNGDKITMIDASQAKRVPSYRQSSQLTWMTGVAGVHAFRLKQGAK